MPALAGNGPGPAARPAAASTQTAGYRAGGPGPGAGTGICRDAPALPAGTLTSAQKTTLASTAEQEKLAHDLYAAFADRYGIAVFSRIAAAETRHLDAIRAGLTAYGVTDPTAGKAAGAFATPAVQATYDRLLAQGKASQDAALQAGQVVERAEIAALTKALDGLDAANLRQVYGNLLDASQAHLTAFGNWLGR